MDAYLKISRRGMVTRVLYCRLWGTLSGDSVRARTAHRERRGPLVLSGTPFLPCSASGIPLCGCFTVGRKSYRREGEKGIFSGWVSYESSDSGLVIGGREPVGPGHAG